MEQTIYVGGLVGANNEENGSITTCYSTGSVSGTDGDVGGLVGLNWGIVTSCYATGSVTGGYEVGGLVGENDRYVTSCYATGSVTGYEEVGGLVGENDGSVTSCYATGSVTGYEYVGGLVGWNYIDVVTSCYATGSVTGYEYVGGLVGENWASVTSSFWDTQTSGQTTSAGGMGMTTAQMKSLLTFTSVGWNFYGNPAVWFMPVDGYPILTWQTSAPMPAPTFSGGAGEPNNPYQIATEAELLAFASDTNDYGKCFILTADIDLY